MVLYITCTSTYSHSTCCIHLMVSTAELLHSRTYMIDELLQEGLRVRSHQHVIQFKFNCHLLLFQLLMKKCVG